MTRRIGAAWRKPKPDPLRRPDPPPFSDATVPSCAKCRNLTTADDVSQCSKGHPFNPLGCGSFRDASRQRDYFVNFYHHDMRR